MVYINFSPNDFQDVTIWEKSLMLDTACYRREYLSKSECFYNGSSQKDIRSGRGATMQYRQGYNRKLAGELYGWGADVVPGEERETFDA